MSSLHHTSDPDEQRLAPEAVSLKRAAVARPEGSMVEDSVGGIKAPAIMSTTMAGIITSLNRSAERLLGITADQVIGKATPVVFHDQAELDRKKGALIAQSGRKSMDQFEAIVAHATVGRSVEEEWTYIHQRGHRFPVLLSVSAIPDRLGNLLGYCIVAQDKQGLLQAEELLRRQAELLDLANDAIFV
ncbi:MAG: PAS domain-containing protein, partial [Nitrospira sp.]